ncbi:hypothetical protein ACFL96_15470 [Thermoproteota archaeon]
MSYCSHNYNVYNAGEIMVNKKSMKLGAATMVLLGAIGYSGCSGCSEDGGYDSTGDAGSDTDSSTSTDGSTDDGASIDQETFDVTDEISACEDIVVSFNVPSYDGTLVAGSRVGVLEYCIEEYGSSGPYSCTIQTCDSQGNLLVPSGMQDVCGFLETLDEELLDEQCVEMNIPEPDEQLSVDVECGPDEDTDGAQENDWAYPNHAQCTVVDMTTQTNVECKLYRNGTLVPSATNDCGTPLVDMNAPTGTITYKVELHSDDRVAEDSEDVEMDYESPVIGEHNTTGSPGNAGIVSLAKENPQTPNGYDMLWKVIDDNFPDAAGGWNILQPDDMIVTGAAIPLGTDMSELYLEAGLCNDVDGDGTLDLEETNCNTRLVDDF